jgi:hypothetical protein
MTCPECGRRLSERDQPGHLVSRHGYIDLAGIVMPPAAARTCLWDRVFTTGDIQAHDSLCRLLAAEGTAYGSALEAELLRRADALFSAALLAFQRPEIIRLVRCLRQSEAARSHFGQLLSSADKRIRDFGRELVLPELAEDRQWSNASATDVHRLLDKLCPVEDVGDKIRVGQRLLQFGLPASAVAECLQQLRGEQPIACPECVAVVSQGELESHLRRVHRVYQFRGVRQPLAQTIALLFSAVCGPKPDPEAWEAVESFARDEYGTQADAFLATGVSQALQGVDSENQAGALGAAALVIAASPCGPAVAAWSATSNEVMARQLALTLATYLPPPLSADLQAALRPLLAAKGVPRELQVTAAAALVRATARDGPAAQDVLNALVARRGKARAVELLTQLEEQTGPSALIAERRTQFENQIRMRCPRCGVQLRRPQMAEHLWSEHTLLLEGRRVREPWRLVEDWIADFRRQGIAELLVRCRALGQHLDPEHGLSRVYRLFLANEIADAQARRALLAEAGQRGASLCPRCFALVPVPEQDMPRPLNQSHGRLSLGGYCVEVSESGLVPHLTVAAPDGLVFQGREPGRWGLTRQGTTLLLAGPPVTAALLYAICLNLWPTLPWQPVIVFLSVALAVYLAAALYWWWKPRVLDRAVDYTWMRLVSRLGLAEITAEESTFLAGLALTSLNHGTALRAARLKRAAMARREQLDRVLAILSRAVAGGTAPLAHFAALERLAVADEVATGEDPVDLVVDQVGRCFDGRLPLAFAQWLLAEWEGSWWTAGNLARLRVLLCDRAFEAGWEVADLVEAGLVASALADVLQTTDMDGLARLRLLWSLRPRRPWPPGEEVITVFEVAADPERGQAWLRKYPDLLLLDEASPAITVCGQGIVFQETVFTEAPRTIDVKARRDFDGVEYELQIGTHRFRLVSDPAPLVGRLERWFGYHFGEFLPQVAEVHTWQAPEGSKAAQLQEAVACPECRRLLLPRAGEVGREMMRQGDKETRREGEEYPL